MTSPTATRRLRLEVLSTCWGSEIISLIRVSDGRTEATTFSSVAEACTWAEEFGWTVDP